MIGRRRNLVTNARIYFLKPVGMDGPIKIGWSSTEMKRLKFYMNWSPIPLELIFSFPGTYALEQNIHACLASARSHHEWFHATDAVRDLITRLQAGVPIEEAIDLTTRQPLARRKRKRRGERTPDECLRISGRLWVRRALKRYGRAWGHHVCSLPLEVADLGRWYDPNNRLSEEDVEKVRAFAEAACTLTGPVLPPGWLSSRRHAQVAS